MASTPILAARSSATCLVSPKVGAGPFPVKSILREPSSKRTLELSQKLLKRKMDDRYESDQKQGDAGKKRRLVDSVVVDEEQDEEQEEEQEGADKDDEDDDNTKEGNRTSLEVSRDMNAAALLLNEMENDSTFDDNDDDDEYDDVDGAGRKTPKAGAKRRKTVHFDMNLNITTEVGRRTLEETKVLVRRALESHALANRPGHDDQDYIELVDVFSHDTESYRDPRRSSSSSSSRRGDSDDDDDEGNTVPPDELVLYVVALTTCTPMLNKSCINLVRKMLACSWIGRDDKFFRAYVQCTLPYQSNLIPYNPPPKSPPSPSLLSSCFPVFLTASGFVK